MKVIITSLTLSVFALALLSCQSTNPSSAVVDPASSGSVPNVSGFLESEHGPLSNWMNERFEVRYRAITPEMIFEQVPLNDIHYNTENLPTNVPNFDYESENISRKELLKKIAEFWDLEMEYEMGDDGPIAVNVSGS